MGELDAARRARIVSSSVQPDEGTTQVAVCGMSDPGRVRSNNEDSFVICDLTTGEAVREATLWQRGVGRSGALLLVADGMGGEACGEVASQTCTYTIPRRLHERLRTTENLDAVVFVSLLREAIEFANQLIFRKAQSDEAYRGMGTTATAAALFGSYLFVAQVGDSRAYLVRDDRIVQLTRDQTFLNYLADIGVELPAGPEKDSRKHILTQAVGSSEMVDVKVTYAKLYRADRVLVCSDGLYNMVEVNELLRVIAGEGDLQGKCKLLVNEANRRGGTDNITMILAEFSGPSLSPPDPAVVLEHGEFRAEDFRPH